MRNTFFLVKLMKEYINQSLSFTCYIFFLKKKLKIEEKYILNIKN